VAEDVVGMHRARDFAEVVKGLAGVHRHEISGDTIAEAVPDRLEGGLCRGEGFEVAQVGDHELVALVVGAVLIEKSFSQCVKSASRRCTQGQ